MSKEKGKRGFAGSQREAAAPSTKVWADAQAKVQAAFRAFDAAWDAEGSNSLLPAQAEHNRYLETRDALIGTPAPNGAALAFKIGLYGYTGITDNFDVAAGLFQPDRIAKIIGGDDDAEKGLLALYFDALALAGVRATVQQPAAVDPSAEWLVLEETLRAAYETLGTTSSEAPEFAATDEAHEAAFKAVYAYAPKGLLEFARKAVAVVDCGGGHSVDEALARDAEAVIARAGQSSTPEWDAALAGYQAAAAVSTAALADLNDAGDALRRGEIADAAYTALNDAWEAADDRTIQALTALEATPAPNVKALLTKLHHELELQYGARNHPLDTPVGFALAWGRAETDDPAFLAYRDLLRMVDPASPVLDVEPFDPDVFLDAYKAAGGQLCQIKNADGRIGLYNGYPQGDGGHPLVRELETPWKREAVESYLRAYTDPIEAPAPNAEGDA